MKQLIILMDDDEHMRLAEHKKKLNMTWREYIMRNLDHNICDGGK